MCPNSCPPLRTKVTEFLDKLRSQHEKEHGHTSKPPRYLHVLDTKSCSIRRVNISTPEKLPPWAVASLIAVSKSDTTDDAVRLHARSLMNAIKLLGIACASLLVCSGCPGRISLPKRKAPKAISRCSAICMAAQSQNPYSPMRRGHSGLRALLPRTSSHFSPWTGHDTSSLLLVGGSCASPHPRSEARAKPYTRRIRAYFSQRWQGWTLDLVAGGRSPPTRTLHYPELSRHASRLFRETASYCAISDEILDCHCHGSLGTKAKLVIVIADLHCANIISAQSGFRIGTAI